MPRGVTIAKNGHIYVISKNGREVAHAHDKAEALKKQEKIREGRL